MLTSLHIENIAIIRKLDFEPEGGFCAFTGETGAGKSILIDAIGLLCGARSEREIIRSGEDSALVEGVFYIPQGPLYSELCELDACPDEEGNLFIQRKLTSDGRSVGKINERSVPLSRLREVASLLIRIHGQQDTQGLASEDRQRSMLDAFAGNAAEKEQYTECYRAYEAARRQLAEKIEKANELQERKDLISFQVRELQSAKIHPGEEEQLLAEHKILANSEKIIENASEAYRLIYADDRSAVVQLQNARGALKKLRDIIPDGESLCTRLDDAQSELTDIADSLSEYTGGEMESGSRLQEVEDRLETLSSLERKYQLDESGLAQKRDKLLSDLEQLENYDADLAELKKLAEQKKALLLQAADRLSATRQKASDLLASRVRSALTELDMPKVQFQIATSKTEPGPSGADSIAFLISANAGEEMRPIGKIASGGELSRIMLCLQFALADTANVPTMIFDEIDTGISGKTNEKIGRMMSDVAKESKSQVICVTHAAQLASRAGTHFKIEKREIDGRTETAITALDRGGRIAELSRIMGGLNITDSVRKAAEELLDED